jgi:ribosome-interacting GTPase 1
VPANLTPQYLEAEKNFRNAKSTEEKIACLEEMLAVMPKHKGTDHLRAELRTKMAKLTESLGKKSGVSRMSMKIEKAGAAQVAIIGPPNTGKSQIVSRITSAKPTVADYPYTTQTATPGMMVFENIQLQLIDTPPIGEQPPEWWLLNLIRRADVVMIVVSLAQDAIAPAESIVKLLTENNIGLGPAPDNADNEKSPITYKKALIAGNMADLDYGGNNYRALENYYKEKLTTIGVNAVYGNMDELKRKLYEILNVIRVYTKTPGGKPDMTDPIVLEKGSKLEMAAASIHKTFTQRMKFARIWGSGKHDGVMVSRDHVLEDGDIIELHEQK